MRATLLTLLAVALVIGGVLLVNRLLESGDPASVELVADRPSEPERPPADVELVGGAADRATAAEVVVPPPPSEPVAAVPEPVEPPPEEAEREPEPLVELTLKVVGENGEPLPEAAVEVRGPLADGGPPERRLDALGEVLLTLLAEEERGQRVLSVQASAPGRATVQRFVQPDDPLLFDGGELRVVLEPEASLEVLVRDELGRPAASAAVVLIRVRDERVDPLGALRLVTDEEGRARAEGLTAGSWSAQVVGWREYDNAESVEVVLERGANERLELEALRWPSDEYASGRVVGPGAPLTPEECDGLYVRRTGARGRTSGVHGDGSFFVKSVEEELSRWEVVRGDEVLSAPFELKQGWHDVVVTLTER